MLVMSLLVYHWVQNVLSLLASQQDPVTKGSDKLHLSSIA